VRILHLRQAPARLETPYLADHQVWSSPRGGALGCFEALFTLAKH